MRGLRDEVRGGGGIVAENADVFEAEAGEDGGVGGEDVEGGAEGGGSGVMAGEEEEFDLVAEEGLHGGGYGVGFRGVAGVWEGDFVAGGGGAAEVGG